VLTTGLTGCTSNSESLELVLRAVGEGVGSGRRSGSEAGVEVVFCVVLPVRLGRVDWAWMAAVVSSNMIPMLKNRCTSVRLHITGMIVCGRGLV
jgi:hypothetical protein